VTSCEACEDLVIVAAALLEAERPAVRPSSLPTASAVWQRAHWQARQAAARDAARPLLVVQRLAAFSLMAVLVAGAGWLSGLLPARDALIAPAGRLWAALVSDSHAAATVLIGAVARPVVPPALGWVVGGAVAAGVLLVALAFGVSRLADSAVETQPRR
jgi:hypothetical protein